MYGIFKNPSADNDIIHVDKQSTEVGDPADKTPFLINLFKNSYGITFSMTTDGSFHLDHWVCHECDNEDIYNQEDSAASSIGKIREFPYIAQTDRCSCSNHDITKTRVPLRRFVVITVITHNIPPFYRFYGCHLISENKKRCAHQRCESIFIYFKPLFYYN